MFNIGLRNKIKPHQKISSFCENLTKEIFPEFKLKITTDEEFEYSFERDLETFTLIIQVKVMRKAQSFMGIIGFNVFCNLHNKYTENRFQYFIEDENYISTDYLLKRIKESNVYKEFYVYENLFKTWNVVFNKSYSKMPIKKASSIAISPEVTNKNKEGFNLIPVLLKYKYEYQYSYSKRYDFTLVISYKSTNFGSYEQNYEDGFVWLKSLKLISKNKEIIRRINDEHFELNSETDYIIIGIFGTHDYNEGIYNEISNNDLDKIILQYSINYGETHEFEFSNETISKIKETWSIYQELMQNHEPYLTKRKFD